MTATLKRTAQCAPGADIIAGKATGLKPGKYKIDLALTVEAADHGGDDGGGTWKLGLEDFGGPIRANAKRGLTLDDPGWMKQAETDWVDCTLTGKALQSDELAEGIRLINPTFKGIEPWAPGGSNATFGFYINLGKAAEYRRRFVIFGGRVIGLKATEFMESKAIDEAVIGLDFTESPDLEGGFRVRHGAYVLIANCPGLKRVTLRGHHHAVVDCPAAVVSMLAGDLPGNRAEWIKKRPAGMHHPEFAYQRAEICYAAGVKAVNVGFKVQNNTPYAALRCMTPPGQAHTLLTQEGWQERALAGVDELRALA